MIAYLILFLPSVALCLGMGILVANGIYWPLVAMAGNHLLGATVMAAIDRDDRWLTWYKSCPDPTGFLQELVLQLWPVFAIICWRQSRGSRP